MLSAGARIFVGESEEYKASIAAQREAEELAALQQEQQNLMSSSQRPPAAASAVPSTSQAQAQQSHNFANWPSQQSVPQTSAALPTSNDTTSEADQTAAGISKVTLEVDELEKQVSFVQ